CYHAHKDREGAFLNKKPMQVSQRKTLEESLIATGFPSSGFEHLDVFLEIFRELMQKTHGMRRLGSAAMDLAYVAAGRCDGFYEFGLNPWDVAAGIYLVEKAGGTVTGFSEKEDPLFGKEILATNSLIHNEFIKIIQHKQTKTTLNENR
ncbi:MAG: inositol monophosphatase, partial [Bacteroidota bacterium]|nr:inositol monophosphatase [Bacteroidota bacterium]